MGDGVCVPAAIDEFRFWLGEEGVARSGSAFSGISALVEDVLVGQVAIMSAMNSEDAVRERRSALGELVEASAYGEVILRMFLCALIGGRHGAVLVGGMTAGDMIVRSEQLVKIDERFTIAEEKKTLAILEIYKKANGDRNRIIHDFGAGSDRGVQFRSYRGRYHLVARPASTIQEVKAAAEQVTSCWQGLIGVIFDVLGGVDALRPGFEIVREDERGVVRRARSVPGRQVTAGD